MGVRPEYKDTLYVRVKTMTKDLLQFMGRRANKEQKGGKPEYFGGSELAWALSVLWAFVGV